MLAYEGDVEEDFGLAFQASVDEFGEVFTHELCENGKETPVNNENREGRCEGTGTSGNLFLFQTTSNRISIGS